MRGDELGTILSEMYEKAPKDEQVAMVHLFGIRYANEIKESGCVPKDIIENTRLSNGTQMSESYKTELQKGMNLAKHVIDRKVIYDFIKKIAGGHYDECGF